MVYVHHYSMVYFSQSSSSASMPYSGSSSLCLQIKFTLRKNIFQNEENSNFMEDKKMKTKGAMQIILKVSWQEGCKDVKDMWCLADPQSTPMQQAHGLGGTERSHGAVQGASGPGLKTQQGCVQWKLARETGKDPCCPVKWIIGAINFHMPY